MIDRIGAQYGFSKRCSDAQSEWWHVCFDPVCNNATWEGNDPGPSGSGLAKEDVLGTASAVSSSGVMHVFAEAADGSIYYTWQRAGETSWSGGAPGQSVASLSRFAPAP